jgi:hypothetical protein
METKKIIALPFFMLFVLMQLNAQRIIEDRTGNVRSQGNIAGGYLFGTKQPMGYVTGDIDLFIDKQVSVTGSIWLSIPVNNNKTGVKANHAVFWGFNYHPLKTGRWDPFIGLTPGLGIAQTAYMEGDEVKKTAFCPVPYIGVQTGFNYYVGSFFNFFTKVEGVSGQMFGGKPGHTRLDELKLTAGLGWNFSLWKPKHKA